MSFHSLHDYACIACTEPYLPFASGVVCPRCGTEATELQDSFLEEAAAVLELIYKAHARWVPPPTPMNTLGDHYLWLLLGALGRCELAASDDEERLAAKAEQAAEEIHLGLKTYLRPHFATLFRALFPVAHRIQYDPQRE